MKIKRNTEVNFSEVPVGMVFMSGDTPYMRVKAATTGYDDDFNAVSLADGDFEWFNGDERIYPRYDAELLIP